MWGSWGKGSSGGTGAKPASGDQGKTPPPKRKSVVEVIFGVWGVNLFFSSSLDPGRPATSTLNRFSALQQSGSLLSSSDSDRRVPQRYSPTANISSLLRNCSPRTLINNPKTTFS